MTPDDITRRLKKSATMKMPMALTAEECEYLATLAQLGNAGGVPEGFRLALVEPTDRMIESGCAANVGRANWPEDYDSVAKRIRRRNMRESWLAMIAESPPPPAHSPDAGNMVPAGFVGEVVEIGDDETGQPRILIHTTREAIKAHAGSLLFRQVIVALAPQPKDAT